MKYIFHISQSGLPRYVLSSHDKNGAFQLVRMLEKNVDVTEYTVTFLSDAYFHPIDCLKKEGLRGVPSRKFRGVDPNTMQVKVTPLFVSPVATQYWRYTDPFTCEVEDCRFSEPLTDEQAIHFLILEEKIFSHVKPEQINSAMLSFIEPWIEDESLNVRDVSKWKKQIFPIRD